MKRILILLFILIAWSETFALSSKETLTRIPATPLPFDCIKTRSYPFSPWAFHGIANLPMFTYADLGMTKHNDYNEECSVYRKFSALNGPFDIVALTICVSDPDKQILATYNKEGELIDFIEAEVSWYFNGKMCVKQWRINKEQEVCVTHLKVISDKYIPYLQIFDTIQAQRIDTYYQIDSTGKFHQTKQLKYQPRTYTRAYLKDETKNIWEGDEVLIP